MKAYSPEKPPGTFTQREFAEQFKLGRGAARGQIEKLLKLGKIRKAGQAYSAALYALVK